MSDHSDHMKEAATFAENVRRELRSFPADVVADLTDGLESDIASSLADGASLSSPESYAHDLLRGAGLEPMSISEKSESLLMQTFAKAEPLWTKVRDLTEGLAPAWWVFRAWIATQLVGAIVSDAESSRPLLAQWGELPLLGMILFVAFVVLSVKWGKLQKPFHRRIRILSHCVLVVAGALFLVGDPVFSYPYATNPYATNSEIYAPETCRIVEVPNVVGMSLEDARKTFLMTNISYVLFDQDAMVEVSDAPPDIEILQQDPSLGSHVFCGDNPLQLVIDLSRSVNAATSLAPEPSDPQTTTTIPSKSSTTTVPKATTTTSP